MSRTDYQSKLVISASGATAIMLLFTFTLNQGNLHAVLLFLGSSVMGNTTGAWLLRMYKIPRSGLIASFGCLASLVLIPVHLSQLALGPMAFLLLLAAYFIANRVFNRKGGMLY